MTESDRSSIRAGSSRGLESVVRLYVSRPRHPAEGSPREMESVEAAETGAPSAADKDGAGFDFESTGAPRGARSAIDAAGVDLSPLDILDESPGPGEDALPPLRIGEEGLRAEAAFRLEQDMHEALLDARTAEIARRQGTEIAETPPAGTSGHVRTGPAEMDIIITEEPEALEERPQSVITETGTDTAAVLEHREPAPDAGGEAASDAGPRTPLVVLLLGATPLRLRRFLLEAIADPVASEQRGVMLLESALPLDEAAVMLDLALDRDGPVKRRNMGLAARDILMLSPAERRDLFERLAEDERGSDLIVINLELPESILCPRLQFLVDAVVVALTSNESSIYEAYRALRGLPERRPGLSVFAVPYATSTDEAAAILQRFSTIASEFLKLKVEDGGWLELPGSALDSAGRGAPVARLAPNLRGLVRSGSGSWRSEALTPSLESESFFEQLGDWFGPTVAS